MCTGSKLYVSVASSLEEVLRNNFLLDQEVQNLSSQEWQKVKKHSVKHDFSRQKLLESRRVCIKRSSIASLEKQLFVISLKS